MEISIREKNEGPSVTIKKNGETLVEAGKPVEAPVAAPIEEVKKID